MSCEAINPLDTINKLLQPLELRFPIICPVCI